MLRGEGESPAVGHSERRRLEGTGEAGGAWAGLGRAGVSPHGYTVFSVESWEARKGGEVWNRDAWIMLD